MLEGSGKGKKYMVTISTETLCLHCSEGIQNPEVELQTYNYILSLSGLLKGVMFWRRTKHHLAVISSHKT